MGVIRLEALRGLRDAIAEGVPELDGHIGVGQQAPSKQKVFPCLNLYPTGWKYFPDQDSEHLDDPIDDRIVLNVGRHEGTIQMRLSTTTLNQRYEIEQRLLDFFLGQEGRPGILVTNVSSIAELGDFVASWELEGDEWRDEKAFDSQADSIMELTGIIPALVSKGGVYRMDDIRLGLTEDFESAVTEATFDTSTSIEPRVRVEEDGTITPV